MLSWIWTPFDIAVAVAVSGCDWLTCCCCACGWLLCLLLPISIIIIMIIIRIIISNIIILVIISINVIINCIIIGLMSDYDVCATPPSCVLLVGVDNCSIRQMSAGSQAREVVAGWRGGGETVEGEGRQWESGESRSEACSWQQLPLNVHAHRTHWLCYTLH